METAGRYHQEKPLEGEDINRPLIHPSQGQYSHEILIDSNNNNQNEHQQNFYGQNENQSQLANNGNRQQIQGAIRSDIHQQISRSPALNLFISVFFLTKIAVAISFLIKFPETCSDPLPTYLWLCIGCDGFTIFICLYDINIQRNARIQNVEPGPDDTRCLQWLLDIKKLFFIVVFILGNLWIFSTNSDCNIESPNIYKLSLVYLILGYLQLLYPILLVILLCLCLPCIILLVVRLGLRNSQKPATTAVLSQLPKEIFDSEVHKDTECIICTVDYEQGQEITRLNCVGKHYFHNDCIQTWLKINGVCPICRQRIE